MKDPYLQMLVKLSETEEPLGTGITLIVDGFLVTGHVISKDIFMQTNELTKIFATAISNAEKEHPEDVPPDDGKRRYIHLRDARYFTPGQPGVPGNEGVNCRIKLKNVSGFHFGVLSSGDSPVPS